MSDVLVMGDANPDLILGGDVVPRLGQAEQLLSTADLVLGGSAAITAHGLARLGRSTRLVATVGVDAFGDLMCSTLSEAGVDVRGVQRSGTASTGITVVLAKATDRSILTFLGSTAGLSAAAAMGELDRAADHGARHLHVSSFYLQPGLAHGLAGVFARAHRLGLTTSLDTNYDPTELWTGIEPVLPHLDLILPNRVEVCALATALYGIDCHDPLDAGRLLARCGPVVVIKDGSAGAVTVDPDGVVVREPARPASVLDTTGAGDTFNAAYLDARLSGRSPQDCLRRAVVAGTRSVAALGGTGGQPTRTDLDHDLDTIEHPSMCPPTSP